jgi:5S rRNA maturation endonuclease (ribonuclease M5)
MKNFHAEQFSEIMNELRDSFVIVEGKKDKSAVRKLGAKNIVALNGKPLSLVAENISKKEIKEVVIMTDFDREGKVLFTKLKKFFQNYKIKTNTRLRRKLMEFGKNRIEDFNTVDSSLLERMSMRDEIYLKRGDHYGEVSSYFNKIHNKSSHKSKWDSRKT